MQHLNKDYVFLYKKLPFDMKFVIASEIIHNTNCDKNFMCLKEGAENNLCKIKKCFDNEFCLLKEAKIPGCINRFSFGYSDICKCPVRTEIYNKYGI